MARISKNDVAYVEDLHAIINDVAKIVADYRSRGIVPTFSVKAGVIGMVAIYHYNPTNGTGKRGRPRKSPPAVKHKTLDTEPKDDILGDNEPSREEQ